MACSMLTAMSYVHIMIAHEEEECLFDQIFGPETYNEGLHKAAIMKVTDYN